MKSGPRRRVNFLAHAASGTTSYFLARLQMSVVLGGFLFSCWEARVHGFSDLDETSVCSAPIVQRSRAPGTRCACPDLLDEWACPKKIITPPLLKPQKHAYDLP